MNSMPKLFRLSSFGGVAALCTCLGLLACSPAPTPTTTQPSGTPTGTNPGTPAASSTPTTGSSATPPPTTVGSQAPNIDACTLITRDEAESEMGPLKQAPVSSVGAGGERVCAYGPNDSGAVFTIRLYGGAQWALQLASDPEAIRTPESGLGDEAYSVLRQTEIDLWMRKSGLVLNLRGTIGIITSENLAKFALKRI